MGLSLPNKNYLSSLYALVLPGFSAAGLLADEINWEVGSGYEHDIMNSRTLRRSASKYLDY